MKYTRSEVRDAFKEAVSDTALAFIINFPIGWGIIAFANWIGITTVTNVLALVILQNIIFTGVAIIRKTYVRLYFNRINLKNQAEKALTT